MKLLKKTGNMLAGASFKVDGVQKDVPKTAEHKSVDIPATKNPELVGRARVAVELGRSKNYQTIKITLDADMPVRDCVSWEKLDKAIDFLKAKLDAKLGGYVPEVEAALDELAKDR